MDSQRVNSPKLLFLTYTFPPARTIGSVRTGNIAKFLARAGWEVTVVTPDPSVWRYVELPELTEASLRAEGIRRLPTSYRWRWLAGGGVRPSTETVARVAGGIGRRVLARFGIDRTVGWITSAARACRVLTPDDVDVILASGPSFSVFPLAQRVAERLRRPYVLDYRDLWSGNLHRPDPTAVRREAAVLRSSAAVTIVSRSWAKILGRKFGVGAKVYVVSNGYDPEQLASVRRQDFDHFAIVYAGSFYPPKRVISPIMNALRCLQTTAHERRWVFHYYGKHEQHVLDEAQRFGVADKVVIHGRLPRSAVLAALKGAGVAVVITSIAERPTDEDNGMVTGKIFEPIGLGTPTILVAPDASDANLVAETTGLARSFRANDTDGIASCLIDLMNGKSFEPRDPHIYAWETLVKDLDAVLRKVL